MNNKFLFFCAIRILFLHVHVRSLLMRILNYLSGKDLKFLNLFHILLNNNKAEVRNCTKRTNHDNLSIDNLSFKLGQNSNERMHLSYLGLTLSGIDEHTYMNMHVVLYKLTRTMQIKPR